ncbi:hypothetical protein C8R44DRAFT_744001 [Mycena epipterygia]|nr:hypothetical protein C8R44DRAFT_744001 [Mycena epipterygia]
MPTKVMILAQFENGYYIHGTSKWLMGVLAWLKAWWICVGVKQVTDLKSMPLLPHRRGNAHQSHDLAQFVHGYYIRGTLKRLTDVVARLNPWGICAQGLVDPSEYETSHGPEIHAPVALAERKCPQKS